MAATAAAWFALASCSKPESKLRMSLSEDYEGKTLELVSYLDSTVYRSGTVSNGRLEFDNSDLIADAPVLAQMMIDGRVKGFVVLEEGTVEWADSLSTGYGTPLNDRMTTLIHELDSIENLDDMAQYAVVAARRYEENKDNPLGGYFAVESIKFGQPAEALALAESLPEALRKSSKVEKYVGFAKLREATSPGHRYVDFEVRQGDGSVKRLSDYVPEGKYTLVDFWASWCPYCIKELPQLKELYETYKGHGLEIVGVAVRDEADDTAAAVERHSIPWAVLPGAARIPYDIYGFTGIPYHILLGPDGTIISRGESAAQLSERLGEIFGK